MAADGNITKDIIYDAVSPDDFESMLELDRYNARSTAFDKIISATHDHFWDPLDKKYIDFTVTTLKCCSFIVTDGVNEFVGELFGRYVANSCTVIKRACVVADGVK